MASTYPIDGSNVTRIWQQQDNSGALSEAPFASAIQEALDGLPSVLDSSQAPEPTAQQLAASQPYLEVWQNGRKVADISRGGLLTCGNNVDVSAIIDQDGSLTGQTLADQRARLVQQMLGSGAEIRDVQATTDSASNLQASTAGTYLRWLAQNG